MRKWNLSTHIKRKHKGSFNPFYIEKEIVLNDPLFPTQNNKYFSKSFLPEINWFNPSQAAEKITKYKNLLQEISQLSKFELYHLSFEIQNRLQLK